MKTMMLNADRAIFCQYIRTRRQNVHSFQYIIDSLVCGLAVIVTKRDRCLMIVHTMIVQFSPMVIRIIWDN